LSTLNCNQQKLMDKIIIRGAREHNLKNINLEIPKDKLVVLTGVSGSGKSSLAFDTIYAEGQRRYVESLSAYARQFLGLKEKPDVDQIEGLSPAISISERTVSHNPRSTVGTVTEIYDYLRLLFARIGHPHCPKCGRSVSRQTITQITDQVLALPDQTKITILAPVIKDKKGEHKLVFEDIRGAGFVRVRINGQVMEIEEAQALSLDRYKRHNIEVVVDRLIVQSSKFKVQSYNSKSKVPRRTSLRGKQSSKFKVKSPKVSSDPDRPRLVDSLETALELGNGVVYVNLVGEKRDLVFSEHFACEKCGISLPEMEPRLFSFNSPHGACPECSGLGTKLEIDPKLIIPNKDLSLAEGAIQAWNKIGGRHAHLWYKEMLEGLSQEYNFSLYKPVKRLPKDILDKILYGTGVDRLYLENRGFEVGFEGVIPNLKRRYQETESDYVRSEIERYMKIKPCPVCQEKRLKPEALAVTMAGKSTDQVVSMTIEEAAEFFSRISQESDTNTNEDALSSREQKIAKQILKEIKNRLKFLLDVGLSYMTLDRSASTLAGGESQRIRLATQIGSGLSGVLYILDEPTIGLHQRDDARLIKTLKNLRDLGNTVIIVEHDEGTILSSDHIIDIGPGAGKNGGKIVGQGTPSQIKKLHTLTGDYLSHRKEIPIPKTRRRGNGKTLKVLGAEEHNLKKIDVNIPLGKFVVVAGVSGSGKSSLVDDIIARALAEEFRDARLNVGKFSKIKGTENLNKVVNVDQSPIGRTSRSNPATYTGVFNYIRDIFAQVPESKIRGYKAGRFSFNVRGGRCEACRGEGLVRIEMQFLPDVYVDCEECKGTRYNRETLEIHYKGKNIAQVLEMTVDEALEFLKNIPPLSRKLKVLQDVGLGYIQLGQPAPTLSGGEAQRVKLSTELSKIATGRTLYILDEPTTGLHFDDVKKLLGVLGRLVGKGNTVLVIEHNLDVIKSADWIVDLGPEGGEKGGHIVTEGTPEQIARVKKSYTGQYLKKILNIRN